MKIKRSIAALLCIAQLFGMSMAFADETAADTATEQVSNEAEVETEGEAVETELPLGENEMRIYVSTDGSDSNDGSFEKPVKTIAQGVTLAANLKSSNKDKNVSVNIREGEYYITDTIRLSSKHSGTEQYPFVIQSYNGEKVEIKGSTAIQSRKFSQLKDADVLAKIPEDARKHIGVYDLSALGSKINSYIPVSTTLSNNWFIVDDKRQTIAKWPNVGYDYVETVYSTMSFIGKEGKSRSAKWSTATDAYICGFFTAEYSYSEISLASASRDAVEMTAAPYYGLTINNRHWIVNLLEELDEAGEYYIDTKNAKLYYYPPYAIANSTMEITTMTAPMISGDSVSNITIKGIEMKNTRSRGIEFNNSRNIVIDDCVMRNIGLEGVVMTECTNSKVVNSTMSSIGYHAIKISGGDRQTLTRSNNLIDNNHIYEWALSIKGAEGIALSGVGTTITHNLMHSSSGEAVLFSGNEHTINYNEIYDVNNEMNDAGAIYAGRNYTMRGNEIAYNYIHDIDTTATKGGSIFVAALYMDDLFSSSDMHHNVLYNCNLGVMIGGGRNNNFDNNILVDCENAMFMDARGVGWGAYHAKPADPNNVGSGQAYQTLFQIPYDKEPWISMYPEINDVITNDLDNLGRPVGNSIQNNLMFDCLVNMIAQEMITYGTVKNNEDVQSTALKAGGVNPDDIFEDYANQNFNLKAGSEIAKKFPEIAKIDMSQMGLREDKIASEKERDKEAGFRLISPMNGETEISNISHKFQWSKLDAASKYIVKVATDPNMENVVVTHETKNTQAEVEFIPSGGIPYWWTVTGISESQSLKGEFQQTGAPKLIISTQTEKTDKTQLRKNITLLTTLNDSIKVGTTPGTYKKGYKEQVQALLDQAIEANQSSNVLQKEIALINERTDEIVDSIIDYFNYDVVNVGDLLANKGAWVYGNVGDEDQNDYITWNTDGSLSLTGSKGRKPHYSVMMYDEELGDNVAIKFGYKVNVSSNYCYIGLQNDETFLQGGYDIIIKSNALEIQRRLKTGQDSNNGILSSDLNFYVSDDKWVDLEMGALRTAIGTYVYLKADDHVITSFLDTLQPYWSGASKFVFTNPSGETPECFAAVRAAAE